MDYVNDTQQEIYLSLNIFFAQFFVLLCSVFNDEIEKLGFASILSEESLILFTGFRGLKFFDEH